MAELQQGLLISQSQVKAGLLLSYMFLEKYTLVWVLFLEKFVHFIGHYTAVWGLYQGYTQGKQHLLPPPH